MGNQPNIKEDFQGFIHYCWRHHDTDATQVAELLAQHTAEIGNAKQLSQYCSLILHVFGGHLATWPRATQLLTQLNNQNQWQQHPVLVRAFAVAAYCNENETEFKQYTSDMTKADLCQTYAQVANELSAQGKMTPALIAFNHATAELPSNLPSQPEVARALAITANNLAVALADLPDRTLEQDQAMVEAAQQALSCWRIAGGWLEQERAEYRLALCYLAADQLDLARQHAQLCEAICLANGADSYELFFAHELLLQIHNAYCQHHKAKVPAEYQADCVISTPSSHLSN